VEGLSTVDHVRARAGQLGIDPTDLIAALGGLPEQVRAVLADVGSGLAAPLTQMASALMLADQTKQEQCLDDTRIVHARNELQVLAQEYRQVTHEVFATNEELLDAHRKLQKQVAVNEDMFMGVVRALSSAIDAKDTYTHNHSQRVTRVAMLIASEMGLPEEDLKTLEVAGFLHDIGKIGMPENILNKPGRLTDEEYNIVKMHPGTGARILDAIPQLRELVKIIKHHHERFDGGGYPDGSYGQSIPLGARILAVADTYDAITSDRPYRKGAPCEVATQEIRRCCGKQFDPEVVEAMDRVEAKGLLQGDEVAVALADGSSCLATGGGG
jgi:putative nucleotidyltransferase with HDIG domain